MGTPEEEIFVDPSEKTDLPDIIDDFDLDFNAGSEEVGSCSFFSIAMDIIHIRYVCKLSTHIMFTCLLHFLKNKISQWIQHKAKEDNLQKFTEKTEVHIINPPRPNKPLLVLDLDHTLLDFSSKTLTENGESAMHIGSSNDAVANQLKRPYMDEFLTWSYKYYDLVVWSQTSWRWLEVKLTELGMVSELDIVFHCFTHLPNDISF